MNTQRLLDLADHIEKLPHRPIIETFEVVTPTAFNMGTWHCGSICCIGGWAEALYVPMRRQPRGMTDHAAWALGLDDLTADQLFYPNEAQGWSNDLNYSDITPVMAAVVIRDLVRTGSVHWSLAARMLEREAAE